MLLPGHRCRDPLRRQAIPPWTQLRRGGARVKLQIGSPHGTGPLDAILQGPKSTEVCRPQFLNKTKQELNISSVFICVSGIICAHFLDLRFYTMSTRGDLPLSQALYPQG